MAHRLLIAAGAALALLLAGAPAAAQARFPEIDRGGFQRPAPEVAWAIVRAVPAPFEAAISSVRYAPGGDRAVVTSEAGDVALLDLARGVAVWSRRPFPGSDDPISCLDVDPGGKRFLTGTEVGGREDHTSLNVHALEDGALLATLEEDSRFFHAELNKDHRKPPPEEIRARAAMGLGENWRVRPISAAFLAGGARIVALYANVMTGPDLYDRSVRLFDASGAGAPRKLWEYQIVADKETYDEDQPAGFRIGLPRPPIAAVRGGEVVYYGTAHARLHALDEATVKANRARVKIEDMTPPPVVWNPPAPGETDENLTLGFNDLALAPDGRTLFASAGAPGDACVLAFDLERRVEVARSSCFDASRLRLSADGRVLVTGHKRGGDSRLHVIDLRAGLLLYLGPRFGALATYAFDVNPRLEEVAVAGEGAVYLLAPRRARRIAVGAEWTRTAVYLRRGVSLQAFGKGEIEIATRPDGGSFAETDEAWVGEGDGRNALPDAASEGEVRLRASPPGEWTIVGGLSEAEFRDPAALRAGPAWPAKR